MRKLFGQQTRSRRVSFRAALRHHALRIEPLEVRQMLDVSMWQNPDKPLDVDNDQFVVGQDALIIVNRINSGVDQKLPDLQFGEVPDFFYDVDGDGFASASDVLLIANRLNSSATPPVLEAGLANDTGPGGVPNTDGITTDPTISGKITDVGPMAFFTASINDSEVETNIKGLVQPNGTFTLTPAILNQIFDGAMPDGQYTVHLKGFNEIGYPVSQSISLKLDRGIATPPLPDLDAASDTGISSTDNITKVSTPRISVVAEPGSTVTLYMNGVPVQEQLASPTAIFDLTDVPDGTHDFTARAVDGAGNLSSPTGVLKVTVRSGAPVVKMITVPYQDDLTPMYKAEFTSSPALTNGTLVYVDVDRNNDGDYDDPDELGAGQATVYDNTASVRLTKPLDKPTSVTYAIKVRMRVEDEAGNVGTQETDQLIDFRVSNVLKDYVAKNDGFYSFGPLTEVAPGQSGFKVYTTQMTSQMWRTEEDVDKPVWKHWVTFIVPNTVTKSTAFLHITGGSNTSGQPVSLDTTLEQLSQFALLTQSIVVNLPQVPSQPLVFTGDENPGRQRTEDEIIAYSYDEFLKNPNDTEWPVLIAMVKSAVKAMDTAQTLAATNKFPTLSPDYRINDFVITGGSKRGWTTWLVPAVDNRVKAIIPTVFDALNLDEQMLHHYGVYGFFSPAIQDYEDEEVFDRMLTENGAKLGAIVDPYHYIVTGNGNYNIPKYAIVSAGDQFFVSDSSQYYFQDLPGTQNYLRYVPNTGHGLNQDAVIGAAVFYNAILKNQVLPKFTWTVQDDRSIKVTATDIPLTVKMWQSTNTGARDWRQTYTDTTWSSTTLVNQGGGVYVGNVPKPASGATAFFLELTYGSGGPAPFVFTTDMSVQTNLPLFDWPFEVADPVPAALPAAVPAGSLAATSFAGDGSISDALGATAFAASLPGAELVAAATSELFPWGAAISAPLATAPIAATAASAEQAISNEAMATSSSGNTAATAADDDLNSELVDSIFDSDLFANEVDWDELFAPLKKQLS